MKILVANWKLNPLKFSRAQKLVSALNNIRSNYKVVICPPFIYLPLLKTKLTLGMQDIFWHEQGAYTGQVSGSMAKQFKVRYAIVGHSEKRAIGETDAQVNSKLKAALSNKIIPILCVGYGLDKLESDEDVLIHLQTQLLEALHEIDPAKVIVAYEPVWAIGTGKLPTPEHAEKVAMFIRIKFKVKKVLYGGSANSHNQFAFLRREIDGLLVGGSSIQVSEFSKMMKV